MKMPAADLVETFSYLTKTLKASHPTLAYLHCVEARIAGNADIVPPADETLEFIYNIWTPNVFLIAGGFDSLNGREEAEKKVNTVVVYGRHFISNPDLVSRIKNSIPFLPYDRST